MKDAETPSSAASYTGHVKDGVVVFDSPVTLPEGQAVRVEPLGDVPVNQERMDKVRRLQELFAQWTEEDGKLSEEEADRLHAALERSPRLRFRPLKLP
jgi:hypothetical protein